MAVKQTPVKFKTSDGQEFDTKAEAERHEELSKAHKAYEKTRTALGRALARTQKTADGQLFDFSLWGDYYYVTPGWSGMPELSRVHFLGWNFDFDDRDRFTIWQEESVGHRSYETKRREYHIDELYADERTANRALLKACEEWLKEQAARVEELRAKVG